MKRFACFWSAFILLSFLPSVAIGSILYVAEKKTNGSEASWNDAFNNLNSALAVAVSGDEIWVAKGTYYPGTLSSDYIEMKKGVAILGGFDGTEDAVDQRDFIKNITVLSGNIGDPEDETDNAGRMIVNEDNGVDNTSVLDGFTLTAIYANDVKSGAIVNFNTSPTIRNCTFQNNCNLSGGVLTNWDRAKPVITNCRFVRNRASGIYNENYSSPHISDSVFISNDGRDGGGIYNDHQSSPDIIRCTFILNSAARGGGVYNGYNCNPVITDCRFTENSASRRGGAVYNRENCTLTISNSIFEGNTTEVEDGGAICNNYMIDSTITGCTFYKNTAGRDGGAFFQNMESNSSIAGCRFSENKARLGGGIFCQNRSPIEIADSSFNKNEADSGGGVYSCSYSDMSSKNCWFSDNTTTTSGGAVAIEERSEATFVDCFFKRNHSGNDGGAVYIASFVNSSFLNCVFKRNTANYGGALIIAQTERSDVIHCSFSGNNAIELGGAICNFSGPSVQIGNSVLWGNTASVFNEIYNDPYYGPPAEVTFSNIKGGYPGEGNIDTDPLFVAPDRDDLHLSYGSPCINAGSADLIPPGMSSDYEGEPRICQGLVDMGADEFTDTDRDGLLDGVEILHNMDPNSPVPETPETFILYVKKEATGENSGDDWTNAYTELSDALERAKKVERFLLPGDQIWVAAGTYSPLPDNPVDSRNDCFQLVNTLGVYGGFNGTESKFDERDPVANLTVLSGDIGKKGDISDNCYHVVYLPSSLGLDSTAALDGFVITGGNADGEGDKSLGGGLYLEKGTPELSNLWFKENRAVSGAGLFMKETDLKLSGCLFDSNISDGSGGGIQGIDSVLQLERSIFRNNLAGTSGGGVAFTSGSLTAKNSLLVHNTAKNTGGAIYSERADIDILASTISENTSGENGGALYTAEASVDITGTILWQNTPGDIAPADLSPVVRYSCLTELFEGDGNLSADPLFGDPANNDFTLSPDSPCNGAGDPGAIVDSYGESDLAGNARLSCDTIDIGAFELPDPVCSQRGGSEKSSDGGSSCFIDMANHHLVFPYVLYLLGLATIVANLLFRSFRKNYGDTFNCL